MPATNPTTGMPRLNGATRFAGWRLRRAVHRPFASAVATRPRYASDDQPASVAPVHLHLALPPSRTKDIRANDRLDTKPLHTTSASGSYSDRTAWSLRATTFEAAHIAAARRLSASPAGVTPLAAPSVTTLTAKHARPAAASVIPTFNGLPTLS
jgi:hypothetical protein